MLLLTNFANEEKCIFTRFFHQSSFNTISIDRIKYNFTGIHFCKYDITKTFCAYALCKYTIILCFCIGAGLGPVKS